MASDNEPGAIERTLLGAFNVFRDVEVAKRSAPKLVQGIEQTQTPLPRNIDAPLIPGRVSSGFSNPVNANLLLGAGAALLFGVVLIKLMKKR